MDRCLADELRGLATSRKVASVVPVRRWPQCLTNRSKFWRLRAFRSLSLSASRSACRCRTSGSARPAPECVLQPEERVEITSERCPVRSYQARQRFANHTRARRRGSASPVSANVQKRAPPPTSTKPTRGCLTPQTCNGLHSESAASLSPSGRRQPVTRLRGLLAAAQFGQRSKSLVGWQRDFSLLLESRSPAAAGHAVLRLPGSPRHFATTRTHPVNRPNHQLAWTHVAPPLASEYAL